MWNIDNLLMVQKKLWARPLRVFSGMYLLDAVLALFSGSTNRDPLHLAAQSLLDASHISCA